MSCQRGNLKRTRSQAHQNTHAFKNDLYNKSAQTKYINTISTTGVCTRCKDILEWKMKYKKYKLLKKPKTCVKCIQKTVLAPYRMICTQCCADGDICAKCGKKGEIILDLIPIDQRVNNHSELQKEIKKLPVRRKNTILRYIDGLVKNAPGGEFILSDLFRILEFYLLFVLSIV